MSLDCLSSYEAGLKGEPGFKPPRDLELDMWREASKEKLGLVARLNHIPSYHAQEPESEYTKVVSQSFDRAELVVTSLFEVGLELLEALEDILDWFDLGILKCYECLKTAPLPNSWGISGEEAPEQFVEGWGSFDCDRHQGQVP
ncbi:hypothetical protein PISMIDRAFT_16097 [Pisolithus microcarpus 441]|uniref:Uncharacterized protein n=1 Tax=Pisolithus microcarpus 441 TaxID=765257 RepID=A0A0C9YQH6_9AGAM|nr:hypothetical protein PISMIDRAFT_16097 [Pisolithus microcarpus 441]